MASISSADADRTRIRRYRRRASAPAGLEQHKLDRLLELRAVIDSLRCEREASDPLLAWVVEHDSRDRSTPAEPPTRFRLIAASSGLRQCAPVAFRR